MSFPNACGVAGALLCGVSHWAILRSGLDTNLSMAISIALSLSTIFLVSTAVALREGRGSDPTASAFIPPAASPSRGVPPEPSSPVPETELPEEPVVPVIFNPSPILSSRGLGMGWDPDDFDDEDDDDFEEDDFDDDDDY